VSIVMIEQSIVMAKKENPLWRPSLAQSTEFRLSEIPPESPRVLAAHELAPVPMQVQGAEPPHAAAPRLPDAGQAKPAVRIEDKKDHARSAGSAHVRLHDGVKLAFIGTIQRELFNWRKDRLESQIAKMGKERARVVLEALNESARNLAVALSDAYVVMGASEPSVALDLARLDRVTYGEFHRACHEIEDFPARLEGRAAQLGKPAYVVRWANDFNREFFFACPWPYHAVRTLFEPTPKERDAIAPRVARLLKVCDKDAEDIAGNLLNCLGTVETLDKPPRVLCIIDLCLMPKLLVDDDFHDEAVDKVMSELMRNAGDLFGQWSPRFVDPRVIVPFRLGIPGLFVEEPPPEVLPDE
jgi:hypothetical protein